MIHNILTSIMVIFTLLLTGFIAGRKGIISPEASNSISRVVVDITTPALLFVAMYKQFNVDLLTRACLLPLYGALSVLAGFIIGLLLIGFTGLKARDKEKNTFLYLSTVSNFSYMPLPLAYMLFGNSGIILLFLANLGCYFMLWTFGVWVLTRDKLNLAGLKNLLTPPLIGLVVGFIVPLSPLAGRIPVFLIDALNMLGQATVPLVMLSVGSLIGEVDFKSILKSPVMIILAIGRLLLTPALVFLVISPLDLAPMLRNIILLISVMPSASSTPIIVQRFGGDAEMAAAGVFVTTLASIITVPLTLTLMLR